MAQNTIYLTLASIGQKIIAFLYFTLIARYIGVEDTGAYFLAIAIIMIIMVLDDIGITSIVIREIARKESDAKIWIRTVLGIKTFTIPITILIAFFLPQILDYSHTIVILVRIAIIILVADTLSLSFYGVLRGMHKLKYEALGLFIGQAFSAIAGSIMLLFGIATLPLLVIALCIGSLWNMAFSIYMVVRRVGWSALVPTWKLGFGPMKVAFAFFLASVFVKVYSYADSVILERVLSETAVGLYAVAYKFTYAFQFLPLAFVAALYPTMSTYSKDINKLKQIILESFWYVSLIGIPIVFGIWSVAPEVIQIFYGSQFMGSVLPLQILIFALIFIFLDFPIGSLLNATDRQNVKTAIMGFTMVINVLLNLILIPIFGVVGACISSLFGFIFMFFAGWFFACKSVRVKFSDLIKLTYKIFLSAIIMAIFVLLIKQFVNIFIAIICGGIIYIILIFLLGAIKKDHFINAWRSLTGKSIAL